MKILFVSPKGDGAHFVWVLLKEGHDVDWVVQKEKDATMMRGLVPPPMLRVPSPDPYDLIVFDLSGMGDLADSIRRVSPVIGSSAYADRLEHDRVFGLEVMEKAGIRVPKWEPFSNRNEAKSFAQKTGKRYVLKPIGDAPSDATYVAKSAEDLCHFIDVRLDAKVKAFVLQEFVQGVEVSTEAWWTGDRWVALNHTLEEKKLMNDEVGPNTGCAGNVLWMPARRNPLFEQGLEKVGEQLKAAGYVGMIDLNTIATEGAIYGLEWTPRFGYEGTCNLVRLLPMPFADFLYNLAIGKPFEVGEPRSSFAATVRLSVPPYPNAEVSRKLFKVPVQGIDLDRLESFILYDVMMEGDELMTGGTYNAVGCPIGTGPTIGAAFEDVDVCIKRLSIPNLQYRTDIRRCCERRYNQLREWGWLRPLG